MAELTGFAALFPGPTSAVFNTSPLPLAVGTRAHDAAGNEYILCSFSAAVSQGEWVVLTDLHSASPLLTGSIGRVGVVMSYLPTSNDAGWVQIYGFNIISQASTVSDLVSPGIGGGTLRATTYATTPLGTVDVITQVSQEANQIHNAWATQLTPAAAGISGATDASWPTTYTTASSSPAGGQHSGAVLGVFLNYPWVDGQNVARFAITS